MAVALDSCLEPLACLQWVTERPYIDKLDELKSGNKFRTALKPLRAGIRTMDRSRRTSPDFGLLRNKWYLAMTLKNCCSERGVETYCEIQLRNCRTCSNPSYDSLTVECYLKIGNFTYCQSDRPSPLTGNNDPIVIFSKVVDEDHLRPSGGVKEWKVICLFSGNAPNEKHPSQSFSLHVENKIVHMAADDKDELTECVLVSREVRQDMEALSTDISGLLGEGKLQDFQLQCQDQVFEVHRSVLAARSEFFRAMLRSGMQESESGSADIKDLEAPVLQILLRYLYSGKLGDVSEDIVFKLYAAADEYGICSLFAACSYWLIKNLTVDNCINYLNAADSHPNPDLKVAAISFIIAHPGVFKGTAWSAFLKEHVTLASEVLQAYATASH